MASRPPRIQWELGNPYTQDQQREVRAGWFELGVYTGWCLCLHQDNVANTRGPLEAHPLDRQCERCGLGPNLD